MTLSVMFKTHLAKVRAAQGLSLEDVAMRAEIDPRIYADMESGRLLPNYPEVERIRAALGGVAPKVLFDYGTLNTIGDERKWDSNADYKRFYDSMQEAGRLLVSPDEARWMDHHVEPDREVDVFVNLSCGSQLTPHLNLDTIAILDVLGIDFAAGAGRQFCCGTYHRAMGRFEDSKRVIAANQERAINWGAATVAHGCTQCVNTFNEMQRRRTVIEGIDEPGRAVVHADLLKLVLDRLVEMGSRVPWKKEVQSKIVIHGHAWSRVEEVNKADVARLAKLIPGVEVVGMLEPVSFDGFCAGLGADADVAARERPQTREEVEAYRDELASIAETWGADTISPAHHTCLQAWAPFASPRADVRHVFSQLAEALGVDHPDRYKAAAQLGVTEAIVEQTRPFWSAWGMSRELAFQTAQAMFDPAFSKIGQCPCGKAGIDRCGHDSLISVDVVNGQTT